MPARGCIRRALSVSLRLVRSQEVIAVLVGHERRVRTSAELVAVRGDVGLRLVVVGLLDQVEVEAHLLVVIVELLAVLLDVLLEFSHDLVHLAVAVLDGVLVLEDLPVILQHLRRELRRLVEVDVAERRRRLRVHVLDNARRRTEQVDSEVRRI